MERSLEIAAGKGKAERGQPWFLVELSFLNPSWVPYVHIGFKAKKEEDVIDSDFQNSFKYF